MENDANLYTVAGVSITAVCGIVVAWISTRGGKKTANASPDPVEETGHAHTRDVVKAGIKRLETTLDYEFKDVHARFDRLEEAAALVRQSQQRGESQRRLDQRGDDGLD